MQMQANQAGIQLVPHKDILRNSEQFQNLNEEEEEKGENTETTTQTTVERPENQKNDTEDTNAMFTEEENGKSSAAKCSDRVKKGTEIKLPNFYISEKIGTVCLKVILVQVTCERCRTKLDFKVKTNQ